MEKHKATIRIPTSQYAFIEVQIEDTMENIVAEHNHLERLYKGGDGLPDKEWRETLDSYSQGNGTTPETHERMNEKQSWMIHELDKMFARQKYKDLPKDTVHHSLQGNS